MASYTSFTSKQNEEEGEDTSEMDDEAALAADGISFPPSSLFVYSSLALRCYFLNSDALLAGHWRVSGEYHGRARDLLTGLGNPYAGNTVECRWQH